MCRNNLLLLVCLQLFLTCSVKTFGQQDSLFFLTHEIELKQKHLSVLTQDPFHRETLADEFFDTFQLVLQKDGSFDFAFDALKNIGKIYSPDGKLKIYSWNIPTEIDNNLFYVILQFYSPREKRFKLTAYKGSNKEEANLSTKSWIGALYYRIIETKHAGQKYYTLLGFSPNNLLSNKKFIDMIEIDEFDELRFSQKLIQFNGKLTDRVEFEFNEKASMTLRYNEDQKMIIFDHLSPSRPSLEGNYQFYGPDFTYDGLKFEKGIWMFYSNIQITN